jgi:hypothetical protein
MCLGYPLQICPREGLPFPACFLSSLLPLFPVSFTFVKIEQSFRLFARVWLFGLVKKYLFIPGILAP